MRDRAAFAAELERATNELRSRSGDLLYTYGTYRIASKDAPSKILESGNYYRIWKKQAGKWPVVADLTNPVSEDKKN